MRQRALFTEVLRFPGNKIATGAGQVKRKFSMDRIGDLNGLQSKFRDSTFLPRKLHFLFYRAKGRLPVDFCAQSGVDLRFEHGDFGADGLRLAASGDGG